MLAVFLRILAYIYCIDFLKKRPELSVPQNSFRRLIDGIYMLRDGVSPYDGDMIHCQPILLYLFTALIDHPNLLLITFLSFDVVTIVRKISNGYMLNPIAVASCAIFSLSVVCNLITALFILAFVKGSVLFSTILFSVLVQLSLYPAIYICALLVKFSALKERIMIITFSIIILIALLLDVHDLTPNVGIFWYFFIEVFNHFRRFFLWVFQINILVYLVPLSLTLRSNAFLLLQQLMILISVFTSYPSMADCLVYLNFRWGLISGGALLVTIVLAPVMWQMWIVTGSGNANFYFAATLTYSVAQIFLLTDLLYGYLRLKLVERRGITDESKIAVLMFE
uniref:GPI transamidase subunit PIG-U n=1 Tax=Wuchereria bancrofti TaxID=6293 RepID=A0A1I8ENY0_WUCBA